MAKTGTITAYFDCNSPWSYLAFQWLKRNRQTLLSHDITIDINPIFLGGLNVGSGNKPPFTLPAKARYGSYDLPRALRYFKVEGLSSPPFFPILSLLPMRCMLFVKETFSREKFEASFENLWHHLWRLHKDVSKPEHLATCLSAHFNQSEVERIIKAGTDPNYKQLLLDQVAMLVEKGAYGAPWFVVRNGKGEEEPFFGSDRFHFMMQFLEVPCREFEVLEKGEGGGAKL